MGYFIYPAGTPNHTATLEARLDSITSPPYIATGLAIEWRKNGVTVKSGTTDDADAIRINTGDLSDYGFNAADTGAVVDFIIDGTTFSNPVILSNTPPDATSISVTVDAYGRSPREPIITWTYSDADADKQYAYRIKLGTTIGGSDIYDSGFIYGNPGDANQDLSVDQNDIEFVNGRIGLTYLDPSWDPKADLNKDGVVDSSDLAIVSQFIGNEYSSAAGQAYSHQLPTMSYGQVFYWTLEITDGAKTDPIALDFPEPSRVVVTKQGSGIVNSLPVASNLLVNGLTSPVAIQTLSPTFSWDYSDVDGQPQQAFRIIVANDSGFFDVLWDSGFQTGNQTSIKYNFNNTGTTIPSHSVVYVSLQLKDTWDSSAAIYSNMSLSSDPQIIVCTVNDRVNPLNLKTQTPVFTWQYTDIDLDPLYKYDIRVADNNTDLGTDSFIGNVWHPGPIITPEAYQTTFDFDGNAFGSCYFPKLLQPSTIYYFQLKVYDAQGGESEWYSGRFRLNSPPTATNLAVLPVQPFNNDDLEASYSFVDDPGEFESNKTEIKWYKNGTEVISLRNQKIVPSSMTTPGDSWFFTLRPNDGVDYGDLYTSPIVSVVNRPPQVTVFGITPVTPRTGDDLKASWITSDPDDDNVSVSIQWFRNGTEVPSLSNSPIVPSGFTQAGDEWFFTVVPNDGYDDGALGISDPVTIDNTKPELLAILVDGQVLPQQLSDPNPKISWRFFDLDGDGQKAYHVLIGTKPLKVTRSAASGSEGLAFVGVGDGILSTAASDSEVVTGNEIVDTGPIISSDQFYQYKTTDFRPVIALGPANVERYFNYGLETDLATMGLSMGKSVGDVSFKFPGEPGIYESEIEYLASKTKRSTYRLIVDGVPVDEFTSDLGNGPIKRTFKPTRLETDSRIVVVGMANDLGARAEFKRLVCEPLSIFELKASTMVLSGYSAQDDGSIKLAGLAGTASMPFGFPSGTYDVEFYYVTESSGNPMAALSIGGSSVLSFTYESQAKVRVKVAQGISISTGSTIKITGSKNGNASARVQKIVFKPSQIQRSGASLEDGMAYYVSVRVMDGEDWSDWYSTKFFTDGSAWVSNVSNSRGWTIEARFRVIPLVAQGNVSG